jgi:hypothetical protein
LKLSEKTKLQMQNGGAAHIAKIRKYQGDTMSVAARALQTSKVRKFTNSEQGKAFARKGHAAMIANPANVEKQKVGLATWRASDANLAQCKEMAKKSAQVCSRRVLDKDTGIIYTSQRDMAKALGVSEGAISMRVKSGKAERLEKEKP